jgi:hypothetical protein
MPQSNPSRDAEIARAARAGASRNELAERYGLCRTRISQICMAASLPKLKPGRKKSDG